MKLLVVAFSASCLLSLPTGAMASTKATKAKESPNKIGEYVLGLVSCPGRCTSGANYGGILAADNVQQCNPEDKDQRWLIHQAQDDDGEPYTFQSRTNLGRCLGLAHNGGDMDFDAGDMAPANEATCTGGQLTLVDCQDPTAKWFFSGAQLFSTACWIAGLSAAMMVNEDCTSLELSLAANGAPEPMTRAQSFILLDPSFVETIVYVASVNEEGSSRVSTDKQCFANRSELKTTVDKYVSNDCNDYRTEDATCDDIYSNYGWPMNSWCVGKVTDMSYLFYKMSTFNEDISLWDVSQVQYMYGMFQGASSFNGDLSSWDVSRVKYMSYMFYGASSFNGDLSLWNVGRVQDMGAMFFAATSFNGDISLWDISQVQDMSYMFFRASSFNQSLCAWAGKNFPYAKAEGIFQSSGCTYQSTPQIGQGGPFCASTCQCFVTRDELKAAVDTYVSSDCNEGANVCPDITSNYGWPMNSWCVGKVTDMSSLFYEMSTFNEDISSWDVSQVQDMRGMFYGARSFNGNISLWDVAQVQDMSAMFRGASSFNRDLRYWNVNRVRDMSYMFYYASSFNGDISLWDVSQVQRMEGMFYRASSFKGDVSLWDVSQVRNMGGMFLGASSFNRDVSLWDISRVQDMGSMFNGASSFNGDLSSWNVSQVQYMSGMFFGASSFNGNVSLWDVSRVQDMSIMFAGASSFNQNLCAWADKNFPYTKAEKIFTNSGCTYQSTPQIEQGGPFCASTCN